MISTRSGFMLIEVLIAALIATLMSIALFAIYAQVNSAAKTIDDAVNVNTRIVTVVRQLERDIAGVCIPFSAQTKKEEQAQQPQKKSQKKLTHIFYATTKDDQLDMLTFITNNPLQGYWSDRAGKPKPALARVVYRLEQDNDKRLKKTAYKLMRQESSTLDFEAFNADAQSPIRSYTVIKGIKSFTLSYATYETDTDDAQQEIEVTTKQEWDMEKETSDKKRMVPRDVTATISLWDPKQEREIIVSCAVAIVPDFSKTSSQEVKEQKIQNVPAQKNNQQGPALQKTANIMQRFVKQGGVVALA